MSELLTTEVEVRVLRSIEEVEDAGEVWRSIQSPPGSPPLHPFSDYDYFLTRAVLRKGFLRPHVLLLMEGDRAGIVPGLIEERDILWGVGGKSVLRSRGRVLRVNNGGLIGLASRASAEAAVAQFRAALRAREADLVNLHEIEDESEIGKASRRVPFLMRDHFARTVPHFVLDLPATYDEFYQSRSKNAKEALNRARNLTRRKIKDLRVVRYDRTDDLEPIMTDCDAVASRTYQRDMGIGFKNDAATRDHIAWALKAGRLRAHVLYDGARPVAFWHHILYRGTMHTRETAFDADYSNSRPGFYLLSKAIEDSIADPVVERFDFGPMDVDYKRKLCTSQSNLVTVHIFPLSFKGFGMMAKRLATVAAEHFVLSVLGRDRARKLARSVRSLRR